MHPAVEEVATWIARHHLLPGPMGCVIAVSGGCDSNFLLHALASLLPPPARETSVVAHFHHQLRGPDADADRDCAQAAAAALGLRFETDTAPVRDLRGPGESIESAARRLRHAFLAAVARRRGLERIATGHHASDQDELFLLRLLRGAGPHGLAGMPPAGPSPADPGLILVRPLLGLDAVRIREAAHSLGLHWREDASNLDPAFLRNRVRHDLLPLLESLQPGWPQVSRRTRSILADQQALVARLAREWLEGPRLIAFEDLDTALQREVVRVQVGALHPGATFELVEALRLRPGCPVQIAPDRYVLRATSGVVEAWSPDRLDPFKPGDLLLPLSATAGEAALGGMHLAWSSASEGAWNGEEGTECFDAERLGPWVRLRHWQPGDRFRPIGLDGSAKLQDLFTNAGVPPAERRERVVAETADGEIFWVEGLRIGECARLRPSTRHAIRWKTRRRP